MEPLFPLETLANKNQHLMARDPTVCLYTWYVFNKKFYGTLVISTGNQ